MANPASGVATWEAEAEYEVTSEIKLLTSGYRLS